LYCAISADESRFVSSPRYTHLFDTTSGKIVAQLPNDLLGSPGSLMPGGLRYFARGSEASVKNGIFKATDLIVYDWVNSKPVMILTGHSAAESEPFALGSSSGNRVVSVASKGEVLVFDLSSTK
jgi:hypothetical protein